MNIVLVHPAGSNWIPGKKDVSTTANRMPPLGLLSIAAYLEQRHHRVSVEDCLGPSAAATVEETVDRILAASPDLVGFSTTTSSFLDGHDLASRIKMKCPEVVTVFGGVHVSSMGEELLRRFTNIDVLCLGEGEETMAELAAARPLPEIDGVAFLDAGEPRTTRPRQTIADLDSLPFPAYEKLTGFPEKYHLPLFSYIKAPGSTMTTSRGCPYQCSYCDRSVFKRGFRYNSPAYIYNHMQHLRQRFGIRHINIYDDLFTLNRERIETLCEMLRSQPLGLHFNCAVRVGHVDDDLLAMLKGAGCLMVSLGIESGEPRLLAVHKPGVYLDEVRETVGRIRQAGLRVKGLFMMGLPGETMESIQKTSEFALSLDLDDMNMAKFTPFFGAPVWQQIAEQGEMREDWRRMNCLNFVFRPQAIPSWEDLDYAYNSHVKSFYSDRRWRGRFRRHIWQHRHSLLRLIRNLPDFLSAMRTFEPRNPG
ncbi:MAG: B12-binding domain-containing radical SAM protein [Desulfopila sp.]